MISGLKTKAVDLGQFDRAMTKARQLDAIMSVATIAGFENIEHQAGLFELINDLSLEINQALKAT